MSILLTQITSQSISAHRHRYIYYIAISNYSVRSLFQKNPFYEIFKNLQQNSRRENERSYWWSLTELNKNFHGNYHIFQDTRKFKKPLPSTAGILEQTLLWDCIGQ